MIKVSVIRLGSLTHNIDFHYLSSWPSRIFKISYGGSIEQLPNIVGNNWEYTDQQLINSIAADKNADVTVALIAGGLENNYYARIFNGNICVLSFYQMADLVVSHHFSIEDYIIRNIYEMILLFTLNGEKLPETKNALAWTHDETRGCLLDMNPNKTEIIYSMHKPRLCPQCMAHLANVQLPPNFIPIFEKELKRLKKSAYGIIIEWIKKHPIYALGLGAIYGVVLNLIASYIFECFKYFIQK